ncbi:MAG: hypothetical protein RLZZ536_1992 [Planctomycetota bacterium]
MSATNRDVGPILYICQRKRVRVCYGVLGAAIMQRVGRNDAKPGDYAQATVTMIKAYFKHEGPGGICPTASWAVDCETKCPIGYGDPGAQNPNFDPNWSQQTPLYSDVEEFLKWLDATAPGWHNELQSTWQWISQKPTSRRRKST